MIRSMTGYGRFAGTAGDKAVVAELRSLNSKYLDLNLRLPAMFREKEPEIRQLLGEQLQRGKIELTLTMESAETEGHYEINEELVQRYYTQLQNIMKQTGMRSGDALNAIMRMPNVMTPAPIEVDEEAWKAVKEVLKQAVAAMNDFRTKEGASLEKDLREQVEEILRLLNEVEQKEGNRKTRKRERLEEQLQQLKAQAEADTSRFEQELIYYIEKMDINEELVRLRSHCNYFIQILEDDRSDKGKKLNFVSQEMGREINTTGAKAYDAELQRLVVQMKDALEKIKEQLNNVV